MEAEVQCAFCPKVRKQRLMPIHMRICRGVVECQQCRQLVGINGGGRHAQGCRNGGYYAQRPMSAYHAASQPQASPQWAGGQQAYNPNAGLIGSMPFGVGGQTGNVAASQPFPMGRSAPTLQTSAAGITPQELTMMHQAGGNAGPRMCYYCQTPFYGSGNDHLMICSGVPKCPYCGIASLNVDTHMQNECRQVPSQQATNPPSLPSQQFIAPSVVDLAAAQPNPISPILNCSLCNQLLDASQINKQLQCGHICHLLCFSQARSQHSSCPIDQQPVSI